MTSKKKPIKPKPLSSYVTKTTGPYGTSGQPLSSHNSSTQHSSTAYYYGAKLWRKAFSDHPVDPSIIKENLPQRTTAVDGLQLPAHHLSVIEEKSFRTREMALSIGLNYQGAPLVQQNENQGFPVQKFDKFIEENEEELNYYSTPAEGNYYSMPEDTGNLETTKQGESSARRGIKSAPSTGKGRHKRKR